MTDRILHVHVTMHDPDTAAILVHASALFKLALGLSSDHPLGLGMPPTGTVKLDSTQSVLELLQPVTRTSKVEVLQALYLDKNGRLLEQRILNSGTENKTLVSPRQVLQPAMQLDAHELIIAHNHPCGNPTPSTDDVRVTYRLLHVAESIGVYLRDHIILTNTSHFSMREAGLIGPQSLAG